ncbi:MAG: hypothetical protein ABIT96_01525 [Ferruginibacter sp.]
MKAAPVKDLKSALETRSPDELLQLCLRMIKYKKENKELATYYIFEKDNEAGYIIAVKDNLDLLFADVNKTQLYYARKNLRKILRTAGRFIKYSEEDTTEVEIWLYVAEAIHDLNLPLKKSVALQSLYNNLLKKIDKKLGSLHEDLQYDYRRQLEKLPLA